MMFALGLTVGMFLGGFVSFATYLIAVRFWE